MSSSFSKKKHYFLLDTNGANTKRIVEEKKQQEMRIMREKESQPFSFIFFLSLLTNTHHADCTSRKGK